MQPRAHLANFTVAYVITSAGRDVFADMALVSILSMRISNPGLGIFVLCDEKSALTLSANKHRRLDVCDEFIAVPTPDGEPAFRHRWIKTQLCRYVDGNVLYIDAGTLVRGSEAQNCVIAAIRSGYAPPPQGTGWAVG